MAASTLSVISFAREVGDGSTCTCGKSPVIYVYGRQNIINANGKDVLDESSLDVAEASAFMSIALANGLLNNNWDEFDEEIYNRMKPFYQEYALDKNGEVCNDTTVDFSWSADTFTDMHKSSDIQECCYKYDCRIDPIESAKDFADFVECVKAKSGHTRVSIVARCLGTNIVSAYLASLGGDYSGIDSIVFYSGTVMGVDIVNQLFTGKMKVQASGVSSFASDLLGLDDAKLLNFIRATLDMLYATGVINRGTDYANEILAHLYEKCIPNLIRDTFATMPGYWSMVSGDYIDEALNYVFGENIGEYSVLIGKIKNYQSTVASKVVDIMKNMKSSGVKIGIIAKYGLQLKPIVEDCSVLSDNTISTYYQSFGATTATVDGVLSDDYLKSLTSTKYVSIDKKVDASTCLFPEYTWFIKDLDHSIFPYSVNDLIAEICYSSNQITVNYDEEFPQYLKWNSSKLVLTPLTAENSEGGHDSAITYDNPGEESTMLKAALALAFRGIQLLFQWITDKLMN